MPRTKMATALRVSALIQARSSASTVPAVEIQLKNTTGYQAFAFDVHKAFNGVIR